MIRRIYPIIVFAFAGAAAPAQEMCFEIDQIKLEGVQLFGPAEQDSWTAEYTNKCLGLSAFESMLDTVTGAYIDAGYILSRAYLPEQDLGDGTLEIAVVEGSLSDIRINGSQNPRWVERAFPRQIGEPANLRKVEQGLDVFHAMPRWQASMEFDSGEHSGESILDVTTSAGRGHSLKFTSNNHGSDGSGEWISGFSGDATNILGVLDHWNFSLSSSLDPSPLSFGYEGDKNRSLSVDVTVPHGPSEFKLHHSWSDYVRTIPGNINPIQTNGDTITSGIRWKRLMGRDQTTKSYLSLELTATTNRNYVAGTLIQTSSRTLVPLRLTYSKERPLWDGNLSSSYFLETGLGVLGAEKTDEQPTGSPNAQYNRVGLEFTYAKAFDWLSAGGVSWESTASAQFSDDPLYGGQQFSIGGISSLRGSPGAMATGSSGWFWRNELSTTLTQAAHPIFGQIELYGGLDLGRVSAQSHLNIAGGGALGQVWGVRATRGKVDFDLSHARIIETTTNLQRPDEAQIRFSFGYLIR